MGYYQLQFYKSGNTVCTDLFDSTAKKIAESFKEKNKFGNEIGITITSLRRIFDEVKRFKRLIAQDSDFEAQLPYIKMIKSKVTYTVARAIKQKQSEKAVYENLERFITEGIDLIHNKKDYETFVSLFEAVYGFYYELAPENQK